MITYVFDKLDTADGYEIFGCTKRVQTPTNITMMLLTQMTYSTTLMHLKKDAET